MNCKLHDRMYEFEDYFLDMLFEPGSFTSKLTDYQSRLDDGNWQDDEIAPPAG